MDKKDMRAKNLEITLDALRRLKVTSKPNLAKETGLSVVTINAHLDALIKRGDAELITDTVTIGGRPARQYRFVAEKRLALGAYIWSEGNNFKLTSFVLNLFGEVITGSEAITDNVTPEFLQKEFESFIEKYPQITTILLGLDGEEIAGNFETNVYPALKGEALSSLLFSKINRPVTLFRDIHAATHGAGKLFGKVAESETLIGVSWEKSESPRCGILLKGKLYKGRDGFAGALGNDLSISDSIENAAKTLVILTQLWNPHGVIFYNEKLRENDKQKIIELASKEVSIKFLPNLLIRPDIREDYGEGIYSLATSYLLFGDAN
ncbi:MAG: hypothetical protein J6O04_11075 [Selenomonadaceae bacterium]|nr:hypothetical protein [Selenomonadaceae bacterium]